MMSIKNINSFQKKKKIIKADNFAICFSKTTAILMSIKFNYNLLRIYVEILTFYITKLEIRNNSGNFLHCVICH